MSEHPIIFSDEMVRAIRHGLKTQTRRVVTVPWHKGTRTLPYEPWYVEEDGRLYHQDEYGSYLPMERLCPYGQPGSLLWVREAHTHYNPTWCACYDGVCSCPPAGTPIYRADSDSDGIKWRPSIHMRRGDCRLCLRSETVGVERLQAITEADAIAEGALGYDEENRRASYIPWFAELWDSLNAKKPGRSWADNPWVWALGFNEEVMP